MKSLSSQVLTSETTGATTCAFCGLNGCPIWCPSKSLAGVGEWVSRAACGGREDLMFPDSVEATREAKRMCQSCPARVDCIEHALNHGEEEGIWGGKTPLERRRERQHLLQILQKRRAHERELGGED